MSNRISLRTVLIASLDLAVPAAAAPRRPPRPDLLGQAG